VSPSKQFYHCFGCGVHGDAIEFLVAHVGLSFIEAVEQLANRAGMTLPKTQENFDDQGRKQKLHVLKLACEFYTKQWKASVDAQVAVNYLKKRGLTGEIAKSFALGFAPPEWHAFDQYCPKPDRQHAIDTGLIMHNDKGREYDRFRNRILFPIRDTRGQVLGFGARALGDDKPKYLNSPESEIFNKGHILYGLYEALRAKKTWRTAIVVEGYMDVIALAQYGLPGAIASMGTALTAAQLKVLFRHVQDILFCFDGDSAGQQAAFKALMVVLPFMEDGRRVRFMFMPAKTDPDAYIRDNGREAFEGLIAQSVPLSEYLFGQLAKKYPLDSVDGCAQFAKVAMELLEQLPQGVFKKLMLDQLHQLVGARRSLQPMPQQVRRSNMTAPPSTIVPTYLIAAILLRQPELSNGLVLEPFAHSDLPGLALLQSLVGLLEQYPNKPSGAYLKALQKRGFTLQALMASNKRISLLPEDALKSELNGAVTRLLAFELQQKIDQLLLKAKQHSLNDEEKSLIRQYLKA
jgi:DNA primase